MKQCFCLKMFLFCSCHSHNRRAVSRGQMVQNHDVTSKKRCYSIPFPLYLPLISFALHFQTMLKPCYEVYKGIMWHYAKRCWGQCSPKYIYWRTMCHTYCPRYFEGWEAHKNNKNKWNSVSASKNSYFVLVTVIINALQPTKNYFEESYARWNLLLRCVVQYYTQSINNLAKLISADHTWRHRFPGIYRYEM